MVQLLMLGGATDFTPMSLHLPGGSLTNYMHAGDKAMYIVYIVSSWSLFHSAGFTLGPFFSIHVDSLWRYIWKHWPHTPTHFHQSVSPHTPHPEYQNYSTSYSDWMWSSSQGDIKIDEFVVLQKKSAEFCMYFHPFLHLRYILFIYGCGWSHRPIYLTQIQLSRICRSNGSLNTEQFYPNLKCLMWWHVVKYISILKWQCLVI